MTRNHPEANPPLEWAIHLAMESTLGFILAAAGIASCAVVMAAMWGKEALAPRKRRR